MWVPRDDARAEHAPHSASPSPWLRAGAVALPILKCAICPACLSIFGSVFAGARLGLVEFERWHVAVVLVALVADVAILGASIRHHGRKGPLLTCVAGAGFAVAGHFSFAVVEYLGFGLLFAAGIWNLMLLRRHQREAGSCCSHHHGAPSVRHARAAP